MKKRLGQIGNIFLSILIFLSTPAGVFSLSKPVDHFPDFISSGQENPQWHWIFSFDNGLEGNAEEKDSDKEGFSPSSAFESFSRSGIFLAADLERSLSCSTESDFRISRLFLLFNCLRLDPF